jgi:hypothetical protein
MQNSMFRWNIRARVLLHSLSFSWRRRAISATTAPFLVKRWYLRCKDFRFRRAEPFGITKRIRRRTQYAGCASTLGPNSDRRSEGQAAAERRCAHQAKLSREGRISAIGPGKAKELADCSEGEIHQVKLSRDHWARPCSIREVPRMNPNTFPDRDFMAGSKPASARENGEEFAPFLDCSSA